MHGFWRGIVAGGILGVAMSMYMNPDQKKSSGIMGMGMRRRRKTNRMLKGVSKTVREMMR